MWVAARGREGAVEVGADRGAPRVVVGRDVARGHDRLDDEVNGDSGEDAFLRVWICGSARAGSVDGVHDGPTGRGVDDESA